MTPLRRVILLTFAAGVAFLLAGLGVVLWSQETYPAGKDFERKMVDGFVLRGTIYGSGPLTVYIADENMDRYGNQGAVQFHSGLLLARYFIRSNRAFLHYDQRLHSSVKQLARDLLTVLDDYPVSLILAHGQGCYTALEAAQKSKKRPQQILLFSCAARENYQHLRVEQMLHKMALEGAPDSMLRDAESLSQRWLHDYELEPLPHGAHVGRRMIQNSLEKEKENLGITALRENQAIHFKSARARVEQKGVTVRHYRGEFDAFTPGIPADDEQILPGMDSFLRAADQQIISQLELALSALRPELAPSLTGELEKVLRAQPP
ncbi:MAG: hypothetical protein HS115_01615 [Spirochaetales bacterium]|nr:hypothetical protein [Spirochaetales bacterium]